MSKFLCALFLLSFSTLGLSQLDLELDDGRYLNFDKVYFDAPIASRDITSWMIGMNLGFDEKNHLFTHMKVHCADLAIYTFKGRYNEDSINSYIANYSRDPSKRNGIRCLMSVLSYDLEEKKLLVFVDIAYDGAVMARYLTSISGEPIDYFKALNARRFSRDQQMNSLARALTSMSDGQKLFLQHRYVDGNIAVECLNPKPKLDPFTKRPVGHIDFSGRVGSVTRYEIIEKYPDHYAPIATLYPALSKTLLVLRGNYKKLREDSSDENKRFLKEDIVANASDISLELRSLVKILREKNFHIIEMMHFLNQFSDLVTAIDAILKNGVGSDPGFISIIKENIQEATP